MGYSILFMIALIVVSGFIAYFGDLLGRRMGKKRLTLFRLRPRHTAIIVTTITGMLIASLAIGLFLSIDSQFRKIFTQGNMILQRNEELTSENARLETRLRPLRQRSLELEKQVALRQQELLVARADATSAKKARDRAVATVDRLETEIAARQAELANLRSRTDLAESELRKRTAELETVRGDLDRAKSDLAKAETNLTDAQSRLLASVEKLSETRNLLDAADKTLKEQQAKLVEVEKAKSAFEIDASGLRNRQFILRQNDELAREVISPNQSDFRVHSDLYSLLEDASRKAAELGAKTGGNGRAVNVIFRQILNNGYAIFVDDETTCVDLAAQAIGKSPRDVLVQVACAMNTLKDEQVAVELRLYVNNLLFRRGDRIAATTIDGRISEGRILLSLIDFMRSQVTDSALRAGIVPAPKPSPGTTIGSNPQEQVDELMDIVDRIKLTGTPAKVEAYAATDIHAADSLSMTNMRFRIAKAE